MSFHTNLVDADWVAEDFSNIAYLCEDTMSAFGVSVGDVKGYLTCVGFGKRLNRGNKEGQVSKTTIVLSVCGCGATCTAPPVRFRNLKDNAACAARILAELKYFGELKPEVRTNESV